MSRVRKLAAVLTLAIVAMPRPSTAEERVLYNLPLPPVATRMAEKSGPTPPPQDTPSRRSIADGSTMSSVSVADMAPPLHLVVAQGQSLYGLFERHGLSHGDLVTMVRADTAIKRVLQRVHPGQNIVVHATTEGAVQSLVLVRPGPKDQLIERSSKGGFALQEIDDDPSVRKATSLTGLLRPAAATAEASASAASSKESRELGTPTAAAPMPAAAQPAPSDSDATAPRNTSSAHADASRIQRVTIRRGDSLYAVFRRLGVPPSDLARLLAADERSKRLRNLQPGQELLVGLGEDLRLVSLGMELDEERTFRAIRRGDDYQIEVVHHPLERRIATATAVIENSLFLAGQREGLSDRIIMELTEIFGWDVDFALDVRPGDRFTVIYEELYKDGERVRDGHILATEFFNRGRSVRALRYEDETGRGRYFSPEGLSMRKALLRTPVNFSRISSRFSRGRLHPVLQRMRAHKGVDYAAPRGTPVKATGNGRVTFAGRKGGFGKAVIIQHGSTYTTLYAHLSRIHRRARKGQRVEQGDVIGYVGSTGLATGPHLHYEFRVRGVHVDPLRVKLPKALPIEAEYKQDFLRKTHPLVAQLDVLANTSLAASN